MINGPRAYHGRRAALTVGVMLLISHPPAFAQTSQPAQSQPKDQREAPPAKKAEQVRPPAPFTSKAWGVRLETEPPGYVKTLDRFGVSGLETMDWLEFGLEQRTRFELRDDNYRRPEFKDDGQFLLRTRGYVGIRRILDPLRFGIEFQDARQFNSNFPETNRDVDEADFLQAFAELYFKDALGKGYPIQFRAGRMSLEYIDRRLVARNRWRNTTNSFDGFRLRLGQPSSAWQFDFFAVQPVDRRMTSRDQGDEERWLYGLVGAWRTWSRFLTLEPYYFILDEDRSDPEVSDREIHTMGLHAFGPIGKTGLDYDLDTAFQFGQDGERSQRAFAVYGELGYTFAHAWKPRLSFSSAYASGDREPEDGITERFDRLFQSGHPYSTGDLFVWQNTISPKIRLAVRPLDKLRVAAAYGTHWLANDSDAWFPPRRRDPTGLSGDFVGQEIELRIRYQIDPRVQLELGYSHFIPGPFVKNTGSTDDADFFYVQTTLRL